MVPKVFEPLKIDCISCFYYRCIMREADENDTVRVNTASQYLDIRIIPEMLLLKYLFYP